MTFARASRARLLRTEPRGLDGSSKGRARVKRGERAAKVTGRRRLGFAWGLAVAERQLRSCPSDAGPADAAAAAQRSPWYGRMRSPPYIPAVAPPASRQPRQMRRSSEGCRRYRSGTPCIIRGGPQRPDDEGQVSEGQARNARGEPTRGNGRSATRQLSLLPLIQLDH
jgi:hypothetical protein